jgi:hypothetical protein
MTIPSDGNLLDSDEVCTILGITHNNLHQLRYRKQLMWVEKKGKRVYYLREDVETLKAFRK